MLSHYVEYKKEINKRYKLINLEENMKKVLATTMATLLFGFSFPVNTFALPNNTEGLESNIIEDFNVKKFNGRIIDRDPNFRLAGENNRQQSADNNRQIMPAVINSNDVGGVKPEGYVTVTYKVDASMGKFQIGGHDIPKSELTYFVDPKVGVQLSEVSSVSPIVTDTSKYKLDEKNPWIIEPNSTNMQSEVKEDISLTANIKEISNKTPDQANTFAEKLKNGLYPVDISVWIGDKITWKDGVGLDTSVTDPELKKAFDEARFEGDGRNSDNQKTSGEDGKIKVTFTDNTFIEVDKQKLYVFPHVTASTYLNTPKDAVTTTLCLGEGTKVGKDSDEIKGNAEKAVEYKTYKVKPGTNIKTYNYANIGDIFSLIKADVVDDTYSNLRWEPNNFIVSDENKVFTAKATKTHWRLNFDFQYVDADNGYNSIGENSVPQEIKNKLPKETKIKVGENFVPQKFSSVYETVKNDAGQVKIVYEWIFNGWNPTEVPSASKDEKLNGTWKRTQATSADPKVEKITESDKVIKGQGKAGATIKVTLKDNISLETEVGQDKKWEVETAKDLKKDEKVSVTQTEMGKKESEKIDVIVSEKAKENNKPDTNPMPKPENNPDNKPQQNPDNKKQPKPGVTPDKKPLPSPEKKDKENQSGSNYFGLRFKNHTSKTTRVKTQVENKKQNNLENNSNKEEARYIIDVMSGNYQVIKDGVRQNRKMDVLPVIKNDRLMLPLRNLAEMIGAKVEWDQQTRTAIFTNKDLVAKIQIDGNEIVLSNGKVIKMDSKPLNINGRILLSVSNVANVFGLTNGNTKDGIDQNIEWDGDNKTVEINLNK